VHKDKGNKHKDKDNKHKDKDKKPKNKKLKKKRPRSEDHAQKSTKKIKIESSQSFLIHFQDEKLRLNIKPNSMAELRANIAETLKLKDLNFKILNFDDDYEDWVTMQDLENLAEHTKLKIIC